jgi:hypothetical protein
MRTRPKTTLDPHLYTQVGLDSSALTMLGTVVHQPKVPGRYRGVVHYGPEVRAVFFVNADPDSPAAQATIDLARLDPPPSAAPDGECCSDGSRAATEFSVNPRGYLLFHVSAGAGGYYVHLRRIDAKEEDRGYDTRILRDGDIFTAMLLRPGVYSITNTQTRARTRAVVAYPVVGSEAYVPPPPIRLVCGKDAFEHTGTLELGVGQGLLFEAKSPSHLQIKLEQADDGPPRKRQRTSLRRQSLKSS